MPKTLAAWSLLGRSVCNASSGISGAGPSAAFPWAPAARMVRGAQRPRAQPTAAPTATTTGNRTPKTNSATKEPTATAISAGWPSAAADPYDGLGNDSQHRRRQPGEQRQDQSGIARAHVHGGQREQGDHAGQYEQDAGDQAAADPVEQPPDVDGELLSLRAGQQGAVTQGVQEAGVARSSASPRPGCVA